MDWPEFMKSGEKYLNNKFKNPYFANVTFVWLYTHKAIVYYLLHFDSGIGVYDRLTFLHNQIYYFQLGPFKGFFGGLLFALLVGFITMTAFDILGSIGYAVMKVSKRISVRIRRFVNEPAWIQRELHDALVIDLNDARTKFAGEKEKALGALRDNFELNRKIDELTSEANTSKERLETLDKILDEQENPKRRLTLAREMDKPILFMAGEWENSFRGPKATATERFTCDENGNYIVNGVTLFLITNFNISGDWVTFDKTEVDTNKKLTSNRLVVINNNHMMGYEDNSVLIEYKRIVEEIPNVKNNTSLKQWKW